MLRFTPTTVASGVYVRLELERTTPSYRPERNRAVYDRFFTNNQPCASPGLQRLLKHSLNAIAHIQTPEVIPPLDGDECTNVTLNEFEHRYTLAPTEDQFNAICTDNPWAMFSECVAENCNLNRLEFPQVRDEFQGNLVATIHEHCVKPKLTIVFYMSGYLFNELAIITELGRHYQLDVHLIMDHGEYLSLLVSPQYNPLAAEGKLGFQFTEPDLSPGRASWFQGYTYRYLKVLEWCQSLDIALDLTVYDSTSAFIEAGIQPDVCVGIDYVDDNVKYQVCTFIETVLSLPVPHMLVGSLRTNGVGSSEVYTGGRLRGSATLPNNISLTLKKKLKAETVKMETDKFDIKMELNGTHYTLTNCAMTSTGRWYCKYISLRGRQLLKEIEASNDAYQSQLVNTWASMKPLW